MDPRRVVRRKRCRQSADDDIGSRSDAWWHATKGASDDRGRRPRARGCLLASGPAVVQPVGDNTGGAGACDARRCPDPRCDDMSMQAVTVNAPPEDIWPWLVQIGYQRGGLYSYDWLDRLFGFLDRPSATRILPEFQQLAVGDTVPWGSTGTELTVEVLEPLRALALSYEGRGFVWVWQFGLYPLDRATNTFRHARHRACTGDTAVVARRAHHGAGGVRHDAPRVARRQGAGRSAARIGLRRRTPPQHDFADDGRGRRRSCTGVRVKAIASRLRPWRRPAP